MLVHDDDVFFSVRIKTLRDANMHMHTYLYRRLNLKSKNGILPHRWICDYNKESLTVIHMNKNTLKKKLFRSNNATAHRFKDVLFDCHSME